MIHAHDFLAAAAPKRPALPRLPDAVPLTPAGYLVLRRKAAGLTERQLADRLARLFERGAFGETALTGDPIDGYMLHLVRGLEMPNAVARHRATIDGLALAMPLDGDVYFQLAGAANRHPRVCRSCGCSANDACQHEHLGNCAWESPTRCTHCATREVR